MYAVVYSKASGHYYVKTNYQESDLNSLTWELVKTFDSEQEACEYRGECLADQHLQKQEQLAADKCYER